MTPIAQDTKPLPEIPYRGIESFRFIDQRLFCAREEETWDLLRNILINRGVLLYGDSGSGKSSLVNAGLIPEAIKERLYAHRLRVQPRRGREIKVERIPIETDDGPPYLPSDLTDPAARDDNALSFEISLEEFHKQLDRLRQRRSVDEPRPLLIFDQFEEFITLFEDTAPGGSTLPSKDAPSTIQGSILTVLTSILQDEGLPVKLLFVFREEYLAKLNILFKAAPELLDQYVRLLPPRVEEAQDIILAPFADEEVKERFAGKPSHVRDLEHLAKQIAIQIQQRSENGFINLTELQIVCRKLWDSRDPAKYFESNGSDIQKVLEGYWADSLKKLGDLYEPSIALLGHMITSTNTRNIVSEPDLKSFEKENFSEEQISRALNALVDSRLVRREPRHRIYFYEIVSEFLVPWIRAKKTARLAQIEAERLAAQTRQKLKQVEKERRILIVLGLVLLAGLVVSGLLYLRLNRLKAELARERDRSENLVRLLNRLTSADPKERLESVNGFIDLDKKGELPRDLVQVIVAVTANEKDKEISYAANYFYSSLKELNEVQQSDSELTKSIIKTAQEKNTLLTENRPIVGLPPRVYFQLASNNQRARADKIADALRGIGFIVPPYEIVEKGTPRGNELRFYKTADGSDQSNNDNRDKALAKVREIDGQGWALVGLQPSSSVRPGTLELWFAGDAAPVVSPSPSPTPTATPDVTLKLTFQNEQGRPLSIYNPRVSLERTPYTGRPIIVSSNTLSAPPGKYILFVQAQGYEMYRAEITLQGAEVLYPVVLKPTRRIVSPPVRIQ
ncbi:MAG TPA: ATP-binding protein [Pyrinomonadaceae bacterium]|nr:ATP-binding protein [Pyrinomonadaceae bacterium]